jgi:hypothetical protein
MQQSWSFEELAESDLTVDAVYRGNRNGNAGDDPFPRLLSLSNQGGFRYRGSMKTLEMLVLTSSMADSDWPDSVDRETGVFTYYGDNKKPGRGLHDTPRRGNELLRDIFDNAHMGVDGRRRVPPVLLFANTGEWRDARFLGLAVPGTDSGRISEDLVAIWRVAGGKRFQNYRARFTILDVPVVSRTWIKDILEGTAYTDNSPEPWRRWVDLGRIQALKATRSLEYRTKAEQLPVDPVDAALLTTIRSFFKSRPVEFERCAASIARMMLPSIASMDLTRPSRDGGRDATGLLRIGSGASGILVEFALEAKCYEASNSVGVRETSRLISRLRHRQFGIIVTTSYLNNQAYQELKEDSHPVVVVTASDIVEVLKANGLATPASLVEWLKSEFSDSRTTRPSFA